MVLILVGLAPTLSTARPAAAACAATGEKPGPVNATPWAQQRLNPSAVWPLTRGAGVSVAVIDSGVSRAPAVLRGRLDSGSRDFTVSTGGDPYCDSTGHGTLVAAMIAGRDDSGYFTGIAPDATILSVRAVPEQQNESLNRDIARAIEYAIDQHVGVINLSLTTGDDARLEQAVADAVSNDIVVVAAAGNEGGAHEGNVSYPAAYDGVLGVAGVDEAGQRVDTSQSGSYVDVAAPGADLVGPSVDGTGYVTGDGTSFAAAYVSAVAALLRSYDPTMSAEQVVDRIVKTADRPAEGPNNNVGAGVVNPYRAITTITSTRPNVPAAPLPAQPATADPLASQRRITIWAAVGGLLLAGALLLGGPVLRAGRRRSWRPGRMG